ncbi:MAG: hypothetical protein JWO58_517 [Chitinophagaceae bacterium]|nr:hypothetical protein [Chitinophagaceae bacterium]
MLIENLFTLFNLLFKMEQHVLEKFNGKTILITGATGFVGGRLLEILAENTSAKVKVLVRDYGKAMRLGRYNVEMIKGDINETEVIEHAVLHCDYVFHCAYGNKGNDETRRQVNVDATVALLNASRSAGVTSFVFLSTMSVYGIENREWLTEEVQERPDATDLYAVNKLEAERLVLDFAQKNAFHATVLQPTAVYGPWAPSFIMRPLMNMQNYKFPLIENGEGVCNAVYIDDLCQAMLKAVLTPIALGKKYLINGPDQFSWKDFYTDLSTFLPGTELINVNQLEMAKIYDSAKRKKPILKSLIGLFKINKEAVRELLQYHFFAQLATWLYKYLPVSVIRKIQPLNPTKNSDSIKKVKKVVLPMDQASITFYTNKTKIDHRKAITELGYSPEFDRIKGMEIVETWTKWYYLN